MQYKYKWRRVPLPQIQSLKSLQHIVSQSTHEKEYFAEKMKKTTWKRERKTASSSTISYSLFLLHLLNDHHQLLLSSRLTLNDLVDGREQQGNKSNFTWKKNTTVSDEIKGPVSHPSCDSKDIEFSWKKKWENEMHHQLEREERHDMRSQVITPQKRRRTLLLYNFSRIISPSFSCDV